MSDQRKDYWDKLEIISKPVGSVIAAILVVIIGHMGSNYLQQRQLIESRTRLYAELMSNREQADSSLRKDMLNSILNTFLNPKVLNQEPKNYEQEEPKNDRQELLDLYGQRVLALELLGYNFHDAIDLSPLFKQLNKEISEVPNNTSTDEKIFSDLENRLEKLSGEVISKQIAALEGVGEKLDGAIFLDTLKKKPGGEKIIDGKLPANAEEEKDLVKRSFSMRVLDVDREEKQIRVQLKIITPREDNNYEKIDKVFWVGLFDFPMIDNTRLPNGDRCAIVLRKFEPKVVETTLVYFPGSRASLKEKPYYDEIIYQVLEKDSNL